MCYAGGPYCEKDISQALNKAKSDYKINPTEKNARKIVSLKEKMKMTPSYVSALKAKDPELGEKAEKEYNARLDSAKAYSRMRKDSSAQLDAVIEERKQLQTKIDKLESAKHSVETAIPKSIATPMGEIANTKDNRERFVAKAEARIKQLEDAKGDIKEGHNGTLDTQIQKIREAKELVKNHQDPDRVSTPYGEISTEKDNADRFVAKVTHKLEQHNERKAVLDARVEAIKANNKQNLQNHKDGKPVSLWSYDAREEI